MADRIFVSIAVHKPEKLAELPGALTAARRMAKWAADNQYRVVSVDDAIDPKTGRPRPVTTELLRSELLKAIGEIQAETAIRRIVVFFAGHGAAKGLNEPYWLLSQWWTEPEEAVDVNAFIRMLQYYAPTQVSLIGDACQVIHKDFVDVKGSAILPRSEEEPSTFEVDKFSAAGVAEEAFMIKAKGSMEAYCIFTEVLLDALEGDAQAALVPSTGGELAVTSGSLAKFVTTEVPRVAGLHNLTMRPEPLPGFWSDLVYVRFPGSWTAAPGSKAVSPASFTGTLSPETVSATNDQLEKFRADQAAKASEIRSDLQRAAVPTHFETGCGLAVTGVDARSVTAIKGRVEIDDTHPGWYRIYADGTQWNRDWADVVVDLGNGQHAYVCGVLGFIAALQVHQTGDINLLHRSVMVPAGHAHEDFVREALARLSAGLLDTGSIVDIAARARQEKHVDFTLGCLAAYLYASIGDFDGIRSIAYFYDHERQVLPLDIALLSGGPIRMLENGRFVVDIPATGRREGRTDLERRTLFTHEATLAVSNVEIAGRAPWFRSGWRAIESANLHESAAPWREQALAIVPHLGRGEFTSVNEQGAAMLYELLAAAPAASAVEVPEERSASA